jgi:hypothetical protein
MQRTGTPYLVSTYRVINVFSLVVCSTADKGARVMTSREWLKPSVAKHCRHDGQFKATQVVGQQLGDNRVMYVRRKPTFHCFDGDSGVGGVVVAPSQFKFSSDKRGWIGAIRH